MLWRVTRCSQQARLASPSLTLHSLPTLRRCQLRSANHLSEYTESAKSLRKVYLTPVPLSAGLEPQREKRNLLDQEGSTFFRQDQQEVKNAGKPECTLKISENRRSQCESIVMERGTRNRTGKPARPPCGGLAYQDHLVLPALS